MRRTKSKSPWSRLRLLPASVSLMCPQYTIVSVGKKPETDASNKYRQYSDNVWSTRWRGNITLTINDDGKATINLNMIDNIYENL